VVSVFTLETHRTTHNLQSLPTRRSSDLRTYGPVFLVRRVREHGPYSTGAADQGRRNDAGDYSCIGCRRSALQLSGYRVPNVARGDRKSTRLNSSHVKKSYAVFCLKKKKH